MSNYNSVVSMDCLLCRRCAEIEMQSSSDGAMITSPIFHFGGVVIGLQTSHFRTSSQPIIVSNFHCIQADIQMLQNGGAAAILHSHCMNKTIFRNDAHLSFRSGVHLIQLITSPLLRHPPPLPSYETIVRTTKAAIIFTIGLANSLSLAFMNTFRNKGGLLTFTWLTQAPSNLHAR
jgi:hypothetical protein